MGQMVTGMLYGCVVPEGVGGDDEWVDDMEDLIDDFEKLRSKDRQGLILAASYECDNPVMGFWIAAEAQETSGALKGALDTGGKAVPLASLTKIPRYEKAKLAWKKVQQLAKNRGLKLTRPQLWVVPVEVA